MDACFKNYEASEAPWVLAKYVDKNVEEIE